MSISPLPLQVSVVWCVALGPCVTVVTARHHFLATVRVAKRKASSFGRCDIFDILPSHCIGVGLMERRWPGGEVSSPLTQLNAGLQK